MVGTEPATSMVSVTFEFHHVNMRRVLSSPHYASPTGTKLADDHHDFTSTCAPSDSVRVYHSRLEQNGLENGLAGHHCKYTKGGLCKCRCNKLFKHARGYNPRSLDLYDHTIQPATDAPTTQPTNWPTQYPTPYPTPYPTRRRFLRRSPRRIRRRFLRRSPRQADTGT